MSVDTNLVIIGPMNLAEERPSPTTDSPLILITNDDGIASLGLRAAIQAVLPLGELLVAAPDRQWSGAGRSFSYTPDGRIEHHRLEVDGHSIAAYRVGASPAVTVLHALEELVPRTPSLVISGINFGENLGNDITHSGTIGAALQGASYGIPTLAVSLQTPKETHYQHSASVDFSGAAHFTHLFARCLLEASLPFDTDILKVDVPSDATQHTPWRLARVSRHTYFVSLPRQEDVDPVGARVGLDYDPIHNPELTEPDSDIYALAVDRVVAVTPLSIDLTSRVDPSEIEAILRTPFSS